MPNELSIGPPYLLMADFEGPSFDDATLQFGPVMSVGVQDAGVKVSSSIRTEWRHFPAVRKLQGAAHGQLVLGLEVVHSISIEIPTKTTYCSLQWTT